MERQRIKKPNQPRYPTNLSEIYTYKDLFVGAVVNLNSFQFHLYDADEYCFKFMEQNTSMFQFSNVQLIKNKLITLLSNSPNEIQQSFKQYDPENKGNISFEQFFRVIKNSTCMSQ